MMRKVIKGRGLGRKLGFPTINLERDGENGVFLVKVLIDGRNYFGVMHGGEGYSCEIHLFDYEGDAYGKSVSVEVIEKIRDTRRFEKIEDLKRQIEEDTRVARKTCQK